MAFILLLRLFLLYSKLASNSLCRWDGLEPPVLLPLLPSADRCAPSHVVYAGLQTTPRASHLRLCYISTLWLGILITSQLRTAILIAQ